MPLGTRYDDLLADEPPKRNRYADILDAPGDLSKTFAEQSGFPEQTFLQGKTFAEQAMPPISAIPGPSPEHVKAIQRQEAERARKMQQASLLGEFAKGFETGAVGQTAEMPGVLAQVVGHISGSPDMVRWGQDYELRNQGSINQPIVPSIADVGSAREGALWLSGAVGQGLGSTAVPLAAGLGLGAVNPALGVAGAFMPSLGLNMSEVYKSARDDPELRYLVDTGKLSSQAVAGSSAAFALPIAALDTLSLRIMTGAGRQAFMAAYSSALKNYLMRVAREGLRGGTTEAVTEGLQAAMSILNRMGLGSEQDVEKAATEILDNALPALVSGGIIAAGHTAAVTPSTRRGQAAVELSRVLDSIELPKTGIIDFRQPKPVEQVVPRQAGTPVVLQPAPPGVTVEEIIEPEVVAAEPEHVPQETAEPQVEATDTLPQAAAREEAAAILVQIDPALTVPVTVQPDSQPSQFSADQAFIVDSVLTSLENAYGTPRQPERVAQRANELLDTWRRDGTFQELEPQEQTRRAVQTALVEYGQQAKESAPTQQAPITQEPTAATQEPQPEPAAPVPTTPQPEGEPALDNEFQVQLAWLNERVREHGFADVDEMGTKAPDLFESLAVQWRKARESGAKRTAKAPKRRTRAPKPAPPPAEVPESVAPPVQPEPSADQPTQPKPKKPGKSARKRPAQDDTPLPKEFEGINSFEDYDALLARKFAHAIAQHTDTRPPIEKALIDAREAWQIAKRGVVPHEESATRAEALAARAGMTVEEVQQTLDQAIAEGTPPVEVLGAAIAASRIHALKLLEAQDPDEFVGIVGDVLIMMVAARAYASETARALGFLGWLERKGGYLSPETSKEAVQGAEEFAKASRRAATQGAPSPQDKMRGVMLSDEIKRALGGDKGIEALMQDMKAQGADLDLNMVVQYLFALANTIQRDKSQDIGIIKHLMHAHVELWRANILTGLFTHQINITTNAALLSLEYGILRPLQESLPGGIGIRQYLRAARDIGPFFKVLADIYAMAKYNALTEYPGAQLRHLIKQKDRKLISLMRGDAGSKWTEQRRRFLPGAFGRFIRNVGYTPLGVEDAIFKVIPFRFELALQKARGQHEDTAAAIEEAQRVTFNQKIGELGHAVGKLYDWFPYSEFLATFVRTMTNLLRWTMDLTPGISQIRNFRALIGKEGPDEMRYAWAKTIVSVAIAVAVLAMYEDEEDGDRTLTGYAPSERRKRALFMVADDQVALKIGGKIYPLYRLDPFAGAAGLTIGIHESIQQGDITPLINAFWQAIASKHFMQSAAEAVEAIREAAQGHISDKGYLQLRLPAGIVTGTVPLSGAISQYSDLTDRYKREYATILEALKAKTPGWREELPPKLDITGEAIENPRYFSPFPIQSRQARKDDVARWLMRNDIRIEPMPHSIKALPLNARQELLRERWRLLGDAYTITHDLEPEYQQIAIRRALHTWGQYASRYRAAYAEPEELPE